MLNQHRCALTSYLPYKTKTLLIFPHNPQYLRKRKTISILNDSWLTCVNLTNHSALGVWQVFTWHSPSLGYILGGQIGGMAPLISLWCFPPIRFCRYSYMACKILKSNSLPISGSHLVFNIIWRNNHWPNPLENLILTTQVCSLTSLFRICIMHIGIAFNEWNTICEWQLWLVKCSTQLWMLISLVV